MTSVGPAQVVRRVVPAMMHSLEIMLARRGSPVLEADRSEYLRSPVVAIQSPSDFRD